ncbi:FliH/SctL family protein [Alteripontixanthobacter maritimus]|nr:hypothetical protein [Alteripontixanthobacter maritimus]
MQIVPDPQAADDQPAWRGDGTFAKSFMADRRYARDRAPAPEAPPQNDAHAAALAEAKAAGRAEAEAEFADEKGRWERLACALKKADDSACKALSQRLVATITALCERTLQPLALDGERLVARCEAAARWLGENSGHVTLRLHPADVDCFDPDCLESLELQIDETLERGSLVLSGPDGEVHDGPAEWRRAIADALGGHCDEDNTGDAADTGRASDDNA